MAKPNCDEMSPERQLAFKRLHIDTDNRAILCLDGGGMRGIMTIQLLKKMEEIAGIPCFKIFDMVAGTSTGAIIAGLIVMGNTASDIEKKYEELVTKVFDKRFLGSRFLNPPKFSKKTYRSLLKEITDKIKKDLTLEQACALHDIDLMITAQDLSAAEETFFSCFKQSKVEKALAEAAGEDKDKVSYYGTYKDVLLRSVMEATMSAPTYFYPLERFVDGGTTTYNNPSMAAFMEAVSYSTAHKNAEWSSYKLGKITMYSFGTGISRQFVDPDKTIKLPGLDIKYWLDWIMTQTGQDASAMQVNTFRSPMISDVIKFRRFEISLDASAIQKLPNIDSLDEKKYGTKWLREVSNDILHNIDMADVTRFDLLKVIGQQMAVFVEQSGNNFQADLATNYKDTLVSSYGDIERIKKQMRSAEWLDKFKA